MLIASSSSAMLYERMLAEQSALDAPRSWPMSAGPTLVKLKDPAEDVEEVVRLLDEATPEGRRANRWLKKRERHGLSVNERGEAVYGGRACCMRLARRIDASLHNLKIGTVFVCDGCGTTWAIQMRTREERPHGR